VTTYEQVHSGAVVLGHDGALWGVEAIMREPVLSVTLVQHGRRVTGYPPAGTEVTVIEDADVAAEFRAAEVLANAFGPVELVAEWIDHG
jgi:hypothetical protein